MDSVLFRWVKRSTYDNIRVKDPATLYFIKDEHVFYKGVQEYGGVQSISYEVDADGDYILSITNGDGTVEQLELASKTNISNFKQAVEDLDQYLSSHVVAKGDENTSAHVKLTDTIDSNNPSQVNDNIAVTPKAVVDYVTRSADNFQRYPNMMSFPIVGDANVLYFANDTENMYTYTNGAYKLQTPSWSNIKIIRGDTNLNV